MSLVESPQAARDAIRTNVDRANARVGLEVGRAGTKLGTKGVVAGTRAARAGAKLGARGARFGVRAAVREKLRPARDATIQAQLAHTSRALASEASELGAAVGSLNQLIRANRRVGARNRTRTAVGILIGAIATYHLDPERGRERRRTTARRLRGFAPRRV